MPLTRCSRASWSTLGLAVPSSGRSGHGSLLAGGGCLAGTIRVVTLGGAALALGRGALGRAVGLGAGVSLRTGLGRGVILGRGVALGRGALRGRIGLGRSVLGRAVLGSAGGLLWLAGRLAG